MTKMFPIALTIAGSDSGGGAGIQADLKTFAVLRAYGTSAITAVTAQNTVGVRQVHALPPPMVRDQIDGVAEDLFPQATKTGMLADAGIIRAVAEAVGHHRLRPLVVDPVMVAKSGDALIDPKAVTAISAELLAQATLITPNRHETAKLLDEPGPPTTIDEAVEAAQMLCHRFGCGACVVKGLLAGDDCVDVLFDGAAVHRFRHAHVTNGGTHGSGCVFSATITAFLAHQTPLVEAVRRARLVIQHAITHAPARGHGTCPVEPLAAADFAGPTPPGVDVP